MRQRIDAPGGDLTGPAGGVTPATLLAGAGHRCRPAAGPDHSPGAQTRRSGARARPGVNEGTNVTPVTVERRWNRDGLSSEGFAGAIASPTGFLPVVWRRRRLC